MRRAPAFVAIFLLLWIVTCGSIRAQDRPVVRPVLYLPVIQVHTGCALKIEEEAVADRLRKHPEQHRAAMRCDPILAAVAQAKAADMAQRGYFSHVNPEGKGANTLVREAGYVLPAYYDQSLGANNIESIAGGFQTVDEVMTAWLESGDHRGHLLGLDGFFAGQIDYGIGYAYKAESPLVTYWVVITAEPGS